MDHTIRGEAFLSRKQVHMPEGVSLVCLRSSKESRVTGVKEGRVVGEKVREVMGPLGHGELLS